MKDLALPPSAAEPSASGAPGAAALLRLKKAANNVLSGLGKADEKRHKSGGRDELFDKAVDDLQKSAGNPKAGSSFEDLVRITSSSHF